MAVGSGRPLRHCAGDPVNMMSRWGDTIGADSRVLLIVNSQPFRRNEIEQAIIAVAARTDISRVSCIAPASLRSFLIELGLTAANILSAQVHGVDLDLVFFLETLQAIRWSAERGPTVVLGTEPYAPNNEEVKTAFELHAAALVGAASFVTHSLPDDRVFCFDVKELWLRASRGIAMEQHHARVQSGMASLERAWKDGAVPNATAITGDMAGQDQDPNQSVVVDASKRTHDRLSLALVETLAESRDKCHGCVRLLVTPAGRWPLSRPLPAKLDAVRRPNIAASGVRLHHTRFTIRGRVDGPFSQLLVSRPTQLAAGDAAVAEGRVYRGGVTIGLFIDNQWVSHINLDAPGSFKAVVVASVSGLHRFVIANCVRSEDRQNAVALHRFGWARRRSR